MDSKLLRYALLIVTLFVGTIFVLMLGMNGYLTQKDTQTADQFRFTNFSIR